MWVSGERGPQQVNKGSLKLYVPRPLDSLQYQTVIVKVVQYSNQKCPHSAGCRPLIHRPGQLDLTGDTTVEHILHSSQLPILTG